MRYLTKVKKVMSQITLMTNLGLGVSNPKNESVEITSQGVEVYKRHQVVRCTEDVDHNLQNSEPISFEA